MSLDDIKANIAAQYVMTGTAAIGAGVPAHSSLGVLTICILVLQNGFTIIGKSAPASADNFDAALGEKLAYEDAVRQVWPLMGYALRQVIHDAVATILPGAGMQRYIGTKAINAKPMSRGDYNILRGWTLPADEDGNDAGFLVEYADGARPNVDGFDGYVSWSPADVFERAYRRA
ncbi:Gp49 family protein [Sphingomonas hankookensis]|uniref:Gp49 family protein n=1 Tax=Sphingomonas hankookensis TaxID=563996 RepID=UPI00363144C5